MEAVERRCNEEIRAARPIKARHVAELTDDVRGIPLFRGKLPPPDQVKVRGLIRSSSCARSSVAGLTVCHSIAYEGCVTSCGASSLQHMTSSCRFRSLGDVLM